jgi:hypothetical protein
MLWHEKDITKKRILLWQIRNVQKYHQFVLLEDSFLLSI